MAEAPASVVSALSGRYRIERELGRGGFATVWRAQDLRNNRPVAVKVLSGEVASAIGPERFVREIEIASRLSHPHVLPLFESGEADGIPYYVTALAQESLRERLDAETQLEVGVAMRLALDVARALEHAHANHVVHRDIKPENILLIHGEAVVADFGVARALEASDLGSLTSTGVVIGSPRYMSPEQASGDRADARSDLYALGCVLYEMLAGQPPFTGASGQIVMAQHVGTPPRPVTDLRPSTPPGLAEIVTRLLSKVPADRFASAAELAAALERASRGIGAGDAVSSGATPTTPLPAPAPARSRPRALVPALAVIAVLALGVVAWKLNLLPWFTGSASPGPPSWVLVADFDAPDSTLAAVTKALLITTLEQSPVVSPVPDAQVREALEAAGRSGERLGASLAREIAYRSAVRAIVVGSVAPVGNGYAISARAEGVDSAAVLASVAAHATSQDDLIPAIERLGRALHKKLGESAGGLRVNRQSLADIRTSSFEAFRHFEAASWYNANFDDVSAVEECRLALALDPEFACAMSLIGGAFYNLGFRDSADTYYRRALSFPDRLTDAQRFELEAGQAVNRGDIAEEFRFREASIAAKPTMAAYNGRANRLSALGRFEEALADRRRALELVVLGEAPILVHHEVLTLIAMRRNEEALERAATLTGRPRCLSLSLASIAAQDWAAAESLGTILIDDRTAPAYMRRNGALVAAGALAARGTLAASRSVLHRAVGLPGASPGIARHLGDIGLLTQVLDGRGTALPVPSEGDGEDERSYRALANAMAGDVAAARAELDAIGEPQDHNTAQGRVLIANALIDRAEGRTRAVVDRLGNLARTGTYRGTGIDGALCRMAMWLVADAWDALEVPDSVVVYVTNAAQRSRGSEFSQAAGGIVQAHARARLAGLYARMGRIEDAERELHALLAMATRPDDDFRQRIDAVRRQVEAARGLGRSSSG